MAEQIDFSNLPAPDAEPVEPLPAATPMAEPPSVESSIVDDAIGRLQELAGEVGGQAVRQFAGVQAARQGMQMGLAESAQGPTELTIRGMEALGLVDEGSADRFLEMANRDRDIVSARMDKEFGPTFMDDVGRMLGRAAPETALAAAIPAAGGVSTAASAARVAQAGAGAAIAGATELPAEEGERGFNIAASTILGLVPGVGVETFQFVRNRFNRLLQGHLDDVLGPAGQRRQLSDVERLAQERRVANIRKGEEISNRTGVRLIANQLDPDPNTKQMVQIARLSPGVERQIDYILDNQPGQLRAFTDEVMDNIRRDAGNDPRRFGARVKDTFKKYLGDDGRGRAHGLLGRRRTDAARDFGRAQQAAQGQKVINLDNYVNELDLLVAAGKKESASEFDEVLAAAAKGRLRKLFGVDADGKLKRTEGSVVLVDPDGMQNLLKTWGRASRGTGKVFKDIDRADAQSSSRRLFGALQDDLDDAIDQAVPGSNELRIARDNYRVNSEKIAELEDSMIGRLLGTDRLDGDVEKAFFKADPEDIKVAMSLLKDTDPKLKSALQASWLENQVTASTRIGPTSAAEGGIEITVPAKLMDMMNGGRRKQFEAVFDEPAVRRNVDDIMQAASRIITNNVRTGGKGVTIYKDLAGVIASQNPTFIARIGSELLTPRFLTKFALGGRPTVDAMMTIANNRNPTAVAVALVKLSNYLRKEGVTNEEIAPPQLDFTALEEDQ